MTLSTAPAPFVGAVTLSILARAAAREATRAHYYAHDVETYALAFVETCANRDRAAGILPALTRAASPARYRLALSRALS